ncbi:hypothetical protein H4R33_001809 [Dimargaris cristalligena]|nr:hypothetical protein H4R33_001809 [Dimargaris cristalligena]
MADQGLTQDDFRKFLATPRPGASAASNDGTARLKRSFLPPKSGRTGPGPTDEVAPENKKPKSNQHWKKPGNEQDDAPKYRDRAAERRQREKAERQYEIDRFDEDPADLGGGGGPSAATTSGPFAFNQTPDEREITYEQSKFLGGDVEHTHLVKGLDFLLLEKEKRRLQLARGNGDAGETDTAATLMDADAALESLLQHPARPDSEANTATTTTSTGSVGKAKLTPAALQEAARLRRRQLVEQLNIPRLCQDPRAQTIYQAAVVEPLTYPDRELPRRNPHFQPGRMLFAFELADANGRYADPFAIPPTVMRSKAELARLVGTGTGPGTGTGTGASTSTGAGMDMGGGDSTEPGQNDDDSHTRLLMGKIIDILAQRRREEEQQQGQGRSLTSRSNQPQQPHHHSGKRVGKIVRFADDSPPPSETTLPLQQDAGGSLPPPPSSSSSSSSSSLSPINGGGHAAAVSSSPTGSSLTTKAEDPKPVVTPAAGDGEDDDDDDFDIFAGVGHDYQVG